MHDWSLISINIDWIKCITLISLRNTNSEDVFLIANGFVNFKITKYDEWGESISINNIVEYSKLENGNLSLKIEIQSGDQLEIEAKEILFPQNVLVKPCQTICK